MLILFFLNQEKMHGDVPGVNVLIIPCLIKVERFNIFKDFFKKQKKVRSILMGKSYPPKCTIFTHGCPCSHYIQCTRLNHSVWKRRHTSTTSKAPNSIAPLGIVDDLPTIETNTQTYTQPVYHFQDWK